LDRADVTRQAFEENYQIKTACSGADMSNLEDMLDANIENVGRQSSVDLAEVFL
jgi:hypothetical protein